jgi:hypothetical protein
MCRHQQGIGENLEFVKRWINFAMVCVPFRPFNVLSPNIVITSKNQKRMSFVLVIITLILLLILLGFSVERMLSKQPLPQPLLLGTSLATGLWSGLMIAAWDALGAAALASGATAVMLVLLRWYNQGGRRRRS